MRQNISRDAEHFAKQNHRHKIWKKVVSCLACLVVFCTTYALILPALTLEAQCDIPEHTHSESCYAQVTSQQQKTLTCSYETLGVHVHTQDCLDAENALQCGSADFVVHEHDAACTDETGAVICQLPVVKEHTHSEACYQTAETHVHGDACYTVKPGELICQIPEAEGHCHSDSCYVPGEELVCQQEETAGHTHTEECRKTVLTCTLSTEAHVHDDSCSETTVVCSIPEGEGHTHSDECFEAVLNCGLPEEEGHQHSDSCYEQKQVLICELEESEVPAEEAEAAEPELICGEDEIKLHTHSDACYETLTDENGAEYQVLICSELEILAHTHTEACFTTTEVPVDTESLTCGLSETEGHSHTEACNDENGTLICTEQTEAHTHTAMCYGTWELVCGLSEHTHSEECQPASELTEEEQAQVDAVIAEIDALETADQVEARLAAYEEAEDWEGYAAYFEEAAQKTQAVRDSYNILSDAQKQRVTNAAVLTQLDWLVALSTLDADNQGTIRESLDGDWAYITDFVMKADDTTESKTHVRTGTSPWDDDNEPGNDKDELNSILRTFDTATYTIQFNTKLRDAVAQEDVGGIKQGRLYFEFILPLSAEEAQFETDAMGWLKSSQNIKYEIVTDTVSLNGTAVTCQVLRGSFTLVPTGSNEAAIGASTNELSVVIRALQMQNGETIQPVFTLWLQYNEVGVTYDETDDRLPESIVTGTNHVCGATVTKKDGTEETHDTCEAATMTGTKITISARPMFNIGLNGINSNNTTVGTFNFDEISSKVTGINAEDMINYGLGKMYGRMNGYGIRIELRGKSGQGMRGAEFPDEGTPIEIDLTVTSSYKPSSSGTTTVVSNYQAQFWSGDANASRGDGSYNNDGRNIYTTKSYIHSSLPYNQRTTSGSEPYKRCLDGGNWSFRLNDDGTIHVTISNFKFDTSDISNFPYSYTTGTKDTKQFYDPDTVKNYWEIEQAVFSVGELWLVQPYYGLAGTENEGQYIADVHGEGQFYTKVQITDLYFKSVGGQVIDDVKGQTDIYPESTAKDGTTDDLISNGQYLKTPGGIDGRVIYTKGETRSLTQPLTDGAQQADYDWATVGTEVTLTSWIFHSKAEAEFVGVAYDNLIKFDDEFFLPDTDKNNCYVSGLKTGQTATVLWAAKPDGSGWTDDEEMKAATPDDLVFYSDVTEIINAGKTPVGVMVEIRGVGEESGENQPILYVDGVIRSDCEPEQVYMVTRCSYAWCKKDVAAAALAYHNTKYPDNQYASAESLSKAEYNEYLKDSDAGFPSRAGNNVQLLSDDHLTVQSDYLNPFWRQDYYYASKRTGSDGTSSNVNPDGTIDAQSVSGLKSATKATYVNGVYESGTGAYYYQDSCLVISYDVTIDKSTAQREKDSTVSKSVYDMGQNQRTVDYVLNSNIDRSISEYGGAYTGTAMTTTVYIEDTLPASLTYIPGSAYFGGDYTQDPTHQNQGTCTGAQFKSTSDAGTNEPTDAHPYLETITQNSDGTTTIRWMFKATMEEDVASWSGKIYFSCSIGTPGVEATDVKDGDEIDNTVKIWTDENSSRPFKEAYGNVDTYGITILKTSAVSLSEISDYLVLDWWENFGFTKNVGNNSGNTKENTIIVNTLPYNGLYRSDFTGRLVVTEFSAALVDESGNLIDSNFKFYYTSSASYAGKLSSDFYNALGDLTIAEWLEAHSDEWNELTMDTTTQTVASMQLYKATNLPTENTQTEWNTYENEQITSIIAVGDLPAGATLKMHVTVKLPSGQAGDYMVSYLSQSSLSSYARAQAVNRSLEGLTWLDDDADGVQDSGEERISGVKVSLYHLVDDAYVPYCYPDTDTPISIQTGQTISVQAPSAAYVKTYDAGRYKFTDLPAGTYAVKFERGSESIAYGSVTGEKITTLKASPVNNTADDTLDSDGVATYSADSTSLEYTWIEGIVMKPAKELVYGTDESKYHDSGFYYQRYELPETGGAGTSAYTLAGLLLCGIACLLYIQKRRTKSNAYFS